MSRLARRVVLPAACAAMLLAGVHLLAGGQRPGPAGAYPKAFPEYGLTLLDEWVGDFDVSRDGRSVAYARRDPRDWFMDVWVSRLSGRDRRCLTCDLVSPSKHAGSVTWHPSGQFLAFSAENDDVRSRRGDRLAEPGSGLNTNLWVLAVDSGKVWRLTDYETDASNPKGVVFPHFSRDGRRLAWSGPVEPARPAPGFEWGTWAIFVADFEVQSGTPVVRNVRTLQPGQQHAYYEVDDWSADGRRMLVSANARAGQPTSGLDIYELDVNSGSFRPLMRTKGEWDQFAHYSPDGRHVLWASSRGLPVQIHSVEDLNWRRDIKTELWMMNRDGSGARRLTFFNETGWRDHTWFQTKVADSDAVYVADNQFMPDGSRVAAVLGYETRQGQFDAVLAVIDLDRVRTTPTPPSSPAR